MNRQKAVLASLAFILLSSLAQRVDSRGGAYIIAPSQETIDGFEMKIPEAATYAVVRGNISVADGFIDFYVTSPSGVFLVYYNKTSADEFEFSTTENGAYLIHLVNTENTNNVTVVLDYGIHNYLVIYSSDNLSFNTGASASQLIVSPPPPFPFEKIFDLLQQLVEGIFGAAGVGSFLLAWRIWNLIRGLRRGRPRDYRGVSRFMFRWKLPKLDKNPQKMEEVPNYFKYGIAVTFSQSGQEA